MQPTDCLTVDVNYHNMPNQNPASVLLPASLQLETLAEMGKGRLKIVWVLSQPSPEWQGGHKGRLTPEVIAQLLGSPAQSSDLALVCGPPGFVHEVRSMG
jgi:NAD(P)H-flavin reductase